LQVEQVQYFVDWYYDQMDYPGYDWYFRGVYLDDYEDDELPFYGIQLK